MLVKTYFGTNRSRDISQKKFLLEPSFTEASSPANEPFRLQTLLPTELANYYSGAAEIALATLLTCPDGTKRAQRPLGEIKMVIGRMHSRCTTKLHTPRRRAKRMQEIRGRIIRYLRRRPDHQGCRPTSPHRPLTRSLCQTFHRFVDVKGSGIIARIRVQARYL